MSMLSKRFALLNLSRRYIQTVPTASKSDFYSGLKYSSQNKESEASSNKWSKYSLSLLSEPPKRRSRTAKFRSDPADTPKFQFKPQASTLPTSPAQPTGFTTTTLNFPSPSSAAKSSPTISVKPSAPEVQATTAAPEPTVSAATTATTATTTTASAAAPAKPKPKRRVLKPRKALISLSANAREHLVALLNQPEPKLIRIGVRNRGCSGLTYNLEYVDAPGKFDEIVEQDGVKVVIDSKALFSIVGSEMDWIDDKLSSRFIFKNPNSKGTCGCGESFMV